MAAKHKAAQHEAAKPKTQALRNGGRSKVVEDRSKWPSCDICLKEKHDWEQTLGKSSGISEPKVHPVRWYIQAYNNKAPFGENVHEFFVCSEHLRIVSVEAGPYLFDHYDLWEANYDGKKLTYRQQTGRTYNKGITPPVLEDGLLNPNAWTTHSGLDEREKEEHES